MASIAEQIPRWMSGWRLFKDRAATAIVSSGGAGVLVAILLIFFYLVYEILPLFSAAEMERRERFQWMTPGAPPIAYMAMEEQGEVALAIDAIGIAHFADSRSGASLLEASLAGPDNDLLLIVEESPASRVLGLGYADGSVRLVQHQYRLSYPDDKRVITPRLEYPYGEEAFQLAEPGSRLVQLSVRDSEEALLLAGQDTNGDLLIRRLVKEEDFLSGEVRLEEEVLKVPGPQPELAGLHVGIDQRWLYQLSRGGEYRLWDLQNIDKRGFVLLADSGQLFMAGGNVSASTMLLGGISLLAGSDRGELGQYFVVRDELGARLQPVRFFETEGQVIQKIISEHRRKGFVALDDSGDAHLFHSTAHRRVLRYPVAESTIVAAALSPRADSLLLAEAGNQLTRWELDNKHPDISWAALWSKVWYESYPEPDYIWQSSASNNDFEPKYSFSPLAFGTLKAAFYAMLIAAPLAICGAIYTAYFMAPALRRKIKPLIELMEALPTVILGFLAGLWLAPFVEANLTGVFSVLLILPVGVLVFAFGWSRLPLPLRTLVPEGWHAAILVPVVCLLGYTSFALNDQVELWLFGGDMRAWITNELGISFDQRNALVVGIAMGLAVIPTIFSISEDAIFSVPEHLSYGSLALGATPWQTLVGVVMPTASPGIFSGLMIGMGRAVGETMIVLMATGNTPIMDANIFEGMRTLAANIAVEVPEAEVDSTHYRVLFLAAFVLFMFTFVVNTLAEIIRQRLRVKYGSL
jgi:phosphate transport system permease protein